MHHHNEQNSFLILILIFEQWAAWWRLFQIIIFNTFVVYTIKYCSLTNESSQWTKKFFNFDFWAVSCLMKVIPEIVVCNINFISMFLIQQATQIFLIDPYSSPYEIKKKFFQKMSLILCLPISKEKNKNNVA